MLYWQNIQSGSKMGIEMYIYQKYFVLMLQCKREIGVNSFTLV